MNIYKYWIVVGINKSLQFGQNITELNYSNINVSLINLSTSLFSKHITEALNRTRYLKIFTRVIIYNSSSASTFAAGHNA